MKSNRRYTLAGMAVLLVVVLVFAGIGGAMAAPANAPAAAITPVAVKAAVSGETSVLVKFFDGEALTADTIRCKAMGEYINADIEFVVDQGTTNTTTVSLLHTNDATDGNYTTGQVVVSANAADADDLSRFDLYGAYTCVQVDVANANTITWTVTALARK